MNDDLYFLPILERALEGPDVAAALNEAFARIDDMGETPRYRRGHQQYMAFMAAVEEGRRIPLVGRPLGELMEDPSRPPRMELLIERDGQVISSCILSRVSRTETVAGLAPGGYRLTLGTGRVLWDGCLAEEDLLWTAAFPGRPLPMAAETETPIHEVKRHIALLGGTLLLRVRPGVAAGIMEIEVRARSEQP